jgi:hypothetical protein
MTSTDGNNLPRQHGNSTATATGLQQHQNIQKQVPFMTSTDVNNLPQQQQQHRNSNSTAQHSVTKCRGNTAAAQDGNTATVRQHCTVKHGTVKHGNTCTAQNRMHQLACHLQDMHT